MTIKKKVKFAAYALNMLIAGIIIFFLFHFDYARNNILLTVFILVPVILSRVLVFGIRKKIISPLANIQDAVNSIRQGKLNEKIEVTDDNELGTLAKALNETTEKLKDSYFGLEKKIEERTKELQNRADKIAQQSAKYETLLSSIGEGVIAVDTEGRVIFMNKEAEQMLGYTMNELFGKVFTEIIEVQDEAGNIVLQTERPIKKALDGTSSRITIAVPYYYVRKDLSRFPVDISASPIIVNGKIIGGIEVFRDITKDKEVDKAKTEFVSLASHELRTPPDCS